MEQSGGRGYPLKSILEKHGPIDENQRTLSVLCLHCEPSVRFKGFLCFNVPATQGGHEPPTSLHTLLVSTARAGRAPPKNHNRPLRRRSSKGCDWSAY